MSSVRNIIESLFAICVFVRLTDGSGAVRDREALWNLVFKNQVKEVAPYGPDFGPVVVNHSITISRLVSLENNILTLSLWDVMAWVDTRLQWDPKVYNGLEEIRVPSSSVWRPDIVLYNSAEEYNGFPSGNVNAIVYHDGKVSFNSPRITRSFCSVNDRLLQEGNEVTCFLKYGSWTHSGLTLNLSRYDLKEQPEVYDNTNRDWFIVKIDAEPRTIEYSCCPDTYMDIRYHLLLRRKQDTDEQEVDRK